MRVSCASVTLFTIAASLPATFAAATVAAAETVTPIPAVPTADQPLVVTADRRETPRANSTASVAVSDGADDRERGYALNPWEWLEGLAGVDAVPANGGIDGGLGRVRIRGANGYDTQWLVDGIPLDDPSTPQGYLPPGFLPPAGIRSVEVVRGAQSGLYGSRAVGGVVNVLTARPTAEHEQLVRAEGGSHGTARTTVETTGPVTKGLGYAVSVDGMRSDGFSALTDADAHGDPRDHEADGVERAGASGRLEWQIHPTTSLYASLRGMALNQEFDGYAAPDDDQSYSQLRSLGAAVGSRSRVSDRLSVDLDLSWSGSERDYRAFSSFSGTSTTEYEGSQRRAALVARYRALYWLEAAVGVDGVREALEVARPSGSVVDEHDWIGGGWVQLYVATAHHDASLSLREDLHSRAGDATTWRVAAAVHDEHRLVTVRGAVGTAFRAPSLFEQFDPTTGNAQLKAQESIGYEAGVRLAPVKELVLESTWFRTDYDSLITYYDPTPFPIDFLPGGYANVSRYAVQGVENALEATAWEQHIMLRVAYTWQEVLTLPGAVDDTYSPYLPEHLAAISAVLRGEPGWFRVAVTRRGAAPASVYDSHPRMEWSTLVDLAVGWAITRTWEVSVRLDNLFDEHYEVTPDYTTSGRALYAGAAARF